MIFSIKQHCSLCQVEITDDIDCRFIGEQDTLWGKGDMYILCNDGAACIERFEGPEEKADTVLSEEIRSLLSEREEKTHKIVKQGEINGEG